MIENISKKQEKVQEKIQKQQELNDKDCRELTDEELEKIVGGTLLTAAQAAKMALMAEQDDARVAPEPMVPEPRAQYGNTELIRS